MEHRCGERIDVGMPVRLSGAGVIGRGTLRNLSSSGAFIETTLPLRELALVRVLQDDGVGRSPRLDAWACVVRRNGRGAGLEWCEPYDMQSAIEPAAMRLQPLKSSGNPT